MRLAAALLLLSAAVYADEALDALAKLQQEYDTAVEEFYRSAREAQAKGDQVILDFAKHPDGVYAERFLALAKEHPKTEVAAKALVMVLQLCSPEEARAAAAATLLSDHLESESLEGAVHAFEGEPGALLKISEKSPHPKVRGLALLVMAEQAMEKEPGGALTILREVKEKYADVPYWQGITLGQKADACIFEVERLSIGKEVPDIEGVDLDGVAFRLSDYRGKVVVLDFWGDW